MEKTNLQKLKLIKIAFEKYLVQSDPNDLQASLYLQNIETFVKTFSDDEPEIEFKIYPDGTGLSWSTITDLIDDTDQDQLKLLTVDLIEQREVIKSKFEAVSQLHKKLKEHLEFNLGNIGQVLRLAEKRFNLSEIKFVDSEKLYYIERLSDEGIYLGVDKLTL